MSVARLQSRSTGARSGVLLALIASALLSIAQPASADIGETIILRCTHNESLSGFSQSDYNKALKELSADTEEYSPCAAQIRAAQLAAAAGGRGVSPGAGAVVAIPASPSQRQAIVHAQRAGSEPVKLNHAQVVSPGVVHVDVASALSTLPTPVLATLAFLVTGLLVAAGRALRNRFRGRTD
jgi:hypothetical protein